MGREESFPHTVCTRINGARAVIFFLVEGANESPPPRWAPAERKSKPVSHSTHTKAAHAVSSSNVLEEAKALQEKITTLVGPAPALTKADIQRSAKLRKGGAAVVKAVAALSDKFGLVVPSQPTLTMVEKINQAESLVALHQELVAATKHVADVMFQAQSQSWAGATAHYSMLRRLSKSDGNVAKTLQPVTQFFAARSTAVTEEAKESRGGARKGSAKGRTYRATKRAEEAQILANSANQASPISNAPTVTNAPAAPIVSAAPSAPTGAPPSPQATATPSNGAGH